MTAQGIKTANLLTGWASTSLIPPRPALLRGMPTARVGQEVIDPITATALALEAEAGDKAILVSADLGAVDPETMITARKTLKKLIPDFEPELMFVNATHTHTSLSGSSRIYPPFECAMTPDEAVEFMGGKIATVATAAWNARKPRVFSWGYGHAVIGHNRRIVYSSGESKMYGQTNDDEFSHVEGYEDHGVDLLYTYDDKKQLIGIIVNLACPSQCSQNLSSISADFWHEARIAIRERLGENIFILPQCSAAGDQSPTLLLHKAAEERMLLLKESVSLEKFDFNMAQRREIGRKIASAVAEVYPLASKDIRKDVEFSHQVRNLELPMIQLTEKERNEAEIILARARDDLKKYDPDKDWTQYSRPYRQVYRYEKLLKRYDAQKEKKTLTTECHFIRLGDVAFATNPFELFLDYGEQIKARSRAIQTFVVQLAGNGSYIPTDRALAGKGYGAEPVSNQIGPGGARMLVDESLKHINQKFQTNDKSCPCS
jgi:hypothetical protein